MGGSIRRCRSATYSIFWKTDDRLQSGAGLSGMHCLVLTVCTCGVALLVACDGWHGGVCSQGGCCACWGSAAGKVYWRLGALFVEEGSCGRDEGDGEGRSTQRRAEERTGVVVGHVLGQEAAEDCFGFLASPKRYPRIQSWEPLSERAMMRFTEGKTRTRDSRNEKNRNVVFLNPSKKWLAAAR